MCRRWSKVLAHTGVSPAHQTKSLLQLLIRANCQRDYPTDVVALCIHLYLGADWQNGKNRKLISTCKLSRRAQASFSHLVNFSAQSPL